MPTGTTLRIEIYRDPFRIRSGVAAGTPRVLGEQEESAGETPPHTDVLRDSEANTSPPRGISETMIVSARKYTRWALCLYTFESRQTLVVRNEREEGERPEDILLLCRTGRRRWRHLSARYHQPPA